MAEHNPPKDILAAGGACRKVRKVTTENNVSRFQTAYDMDNFIRAGIVFVLLRHLSDGAFFQY
ncbi:hypothetical protein EPM78_08205 [Neisseria gonorrhoeae]|uniref:Uncharacterized protein n=1 Tax=Neisseria gonorrhoeae (strain ATCC 700825 / FA 1090) TaxID=242231 RepID=Q5F946_NEIG1|nr:hypothetical protein [Neisseria gonorrhoeae]AAW89291.1 hypothetical protein NGO_0557 [Neisseria gonorrhoeae FA 1090]EFF39376.1 hypothetical protein NGNG_00033 [Neisseria gonorrhoeae F62]AVH82940.1 hypothetical protein A6J46_06705 [Neisseria gonorrhoeae]QOG36467.1 hypothetical protein IBX75_02875 [Neisseria gonorrhoeae]QOG44097.1 hypothetical protein IBX79_02840 [Neisseria gonorrhoeae]